MITVKEHRVRFNGAWVDLSILDNFTLYETKPTDQNSGAEEALIDGVYTGPAVNTVPTVIANKEIPFRIDNQSQLSLVNCLVTSAATSSQQWQINSSNANARTTAYRTTFRPTTLNYLTNTIYGHDVDMGRCLIEHTIDGASMVGDNYNLWGSVLRQPAWFDDDGGIHPQTSSVPGTHNDGLQGHRGKRGRVHGNTIEWYKYNVLNPTNDPAGTTPLDGSRANRFPQASQISLIQHGVGYFPGYGAGESVLNFDSNGRPIFDATWGGAFTSYHNWIKGGAGGIKALSDVSFGSLSGQKVDIAMWIVDNLWEDLPQVFGSYPYPIRIDTNTILNGRKWPATTGQGWIGTTTPAFDFGNRYGTDASIPLAWRNKPVGVRVDTVAASVARVPAAL